MVDDMDQTALTFLEAVQNGDATTVSRLLEARPGLVRLKLPDAGLTPLHLAACYGHYRVADLLIAHGADVSARDRDGDTPLWVGSTGIMEPSNPSVVRLLLDHGADVDVRNDDGRTPLIGAIAHGQYPSAQDLLARGANPNGRDGRSDTPLHAAVTHNSLEMVMSLLDRGADANAEDGYGYTPLDYALIQGDSTIAGYLQHRGARESGKGGAERVLRDAGGTASIPSSSSRPSGLGGRPSGSSSSSTTGCLLPAALAAFAAVTLLTCVLIHL